MNGLSGAERGERRDRKRAILAQMSALLAFFVDTAIGYGDPVDAPMAVLMLGHAPREMTRIRRSSHLRTSIECIAVNRPAMERPRRFKKPQRLARSRTRY